MVANSCLSVKLFFRTLYLTIFLSQITQSTNRQCSAKGFNAISLMYYTKDVITDLQINSLFTKQQNFFLEQIEGTSKRQNKHDQKTEIRFGMDRKHGGKEKMLVSSIFSSSHIIFERLFSQGLFENWESVGQR